MSASNTQATAASVPTTLPSPFHTFPHTPSVEVKPFTVDFPQADIDDLQRRIADAPRRRRTYENSTTDEQLGVTREWLENALETWKAFDWRRTEDTLNSFPNYTAQIQHPSQADHTYSIHFIALFSSNPDAVPVIATHGWPGSVLEFIPLLQHLTKTYTPETLPVHLIVPSLVGYGFSSPPPLDIDFATKDNAILFDVLMRGLGFEKYIAQGGDVGSLVTRYMGELDACKAVHVNMIIATVTSMDSVDKGQLDEYELACLERFDLFQKYEFAYKWEQATKTATIGFVLESSPVALLAWIGEKFLVWSDDPPPPLATILANVTLYWLTNTIPTTFYHYRTTYGRRPAAQPELKDKPVGYSLFKKEILPIPCQWAEKSVNLVWFRRHEHGGHFAALEQPEVFWDDVRDFCQQVW